MVDFGELWRQEAPKRRQPDNAQAWDERARDEVSKYAPSAYSQVFLEHARLEPGETVFDMGCGAGALAIPCAKVGHPVLAADFSPVMLERCLSLVPPELSSLVETKLLSWDEDWSARGLAQDSFDVAFASRSLATADMEESIRKLSALARRKVCATVVAGGSPRVSEALFDDLGLQVRGHNDAAFVFGIATQLGYKPEVRFIDSVRYDCFETPEAAKRAYVAMLRFADELPEGEVAAIEHAAEAWVEEHIQDERRSPRPSLGDEAAAVAPGPFYIDRPRSFSWAFLAWNV